MNFILKSAVAAAAAAVAMTAAASANVITINGGAGTITCTPDCQAFIGGGAPDTTGPGTLSSTNADLYTGTPSNEAAEASRLNTLIGSNLFTGTDGNKVTGTGGDMTFNTLAAYVVLKVGNDNVFIYNVAGGLLNIIADVTSGFGVSHYTEFGDPIPVPAAVWLMGAGLAGLGFAARKKKA